MFKIGEVDTRAEGKGRGSASVPCDASFSYIRREKGPRRTVRKKRAVSGTGNLSTGPINIFCLRPSPFRNSFFSQVKSPTNQQSVTNPCAWGFRSGRFIDHNFTVFWREHISQFNFAFDLPISVKIWKVPSGVRRDR